MNHEEIFDDLEVKCDECNGEGGSFDTERNWIRCDKCNGEGTVITEKGKSLLTFIRTHLDD